MLLKLFFVRFVFQWAGSWSPLMTRRFPTPPKWSKRWELLFPFWIEISKENDLSKKIQSIKNLSLLPPKVRIMAMKAEVKEVAENAGAGAAWFKIGILWKFLQNINLFYKYWRSSLVERNVLGVFGIWDGVLCIYKEVADNAFFPGIVCKIWISIIGICDHVITWRFGGFFSEGQLGAAWLNLQSRFKFSKAFLDDWFWNLNSQKLSEKTSVIICNSLVLISGGDLTQLKSCFKLRVLFRILALSSHSARCPWTSMTSRLISTLRPF